MLIQIRRALGVVALLLAACADETILLPDLTVASVEVSPAAPTLTVGDTMVLTAYPRTAGGSVLGSVQITWVNGNSDVATIKANGAVSVVTAKAPGTVQINAQAEGKTGGTIVNVVAVPLVVAFVQITPSIGALEVGKQFTLSAIARTADSTVIGGRGVHWLSSDPTIVTLAPSMNGSQAVMTAHRIGDVVITAIVDGKQAQRAISIKPVPDVRSVHIIPDSLIVEPDKDIELYARLNGPLGYPVESSAVRWYSSDPAVASLVSINGQRAVLRTHKAGPVIVAAEAAGHTGLAEIRVKNAANVSSLAIVGAGQMGLSMWTGDWYPFKAVVYGPGNVELNDQPIHWRIDDPTLAHVYPDGHIHALKSGETRLMAESGGKRAYAQLTIYQHPAANGMLLKLYPSMDPYGVPRPAIEVGTTTWTDANGVTFPAKKILMGGTINIGRGISGYEQQLVIETWVTGGIEAGRMVARETVIERGQVMYHFMGLFELWLLPDHLPGTQNHVVIPQPGRFTVHQKIGTAPMLNYFYEIQ